VREGTSCGFLRSCWWLPSHASIHYVFGTNNRCFGRVEQPSQPASTRRTLVNHIRQQHLNLLQPFEGFLGFHHASRGPSMLSLDSAPWGCAGGGRGRRGGSSRNVVLRYRLDLEARHLSPATVNLRLAAVRRLAYEAADCGLLSPELAAGIQRVKGAKKVGVRLGNWLTVEQSRRLLEAPDVQSARGKRDRAILA